MDYNKKRDIALYAVIALMVILSGAFIVLGVMLLRGEADDGAISGAKYVLTRCYECAAGV